jgi:release factor glutamine methyltransferase
MNAAAPTRIRDALQAARRAGLDRLDAFALLEHVTQRSRTWLLAHDEELLPPNSGARYAVLVAQRADHVPLAYLVQEKEFHGLRLRVTPDVLVPRPDTETLVGWALELLPTAEPWRVADLGTGSGAIALAIRHERPLTQLIATDASAAALEVARGNGAALGLSVDWRVGEWWDPLQGERFDLVVSNPPYIAQDDPHLSSLRHEPQRALTSGADGLDDVRRIVEGSHRHLRSGGWLLLEHGFDQAQAVRDLLLRAGFAGVESRRDLAGHERCSGGRVRAALSA